jgi:molybdopterin-biosynthesis enzyme MoeA-like protein
MNIGAIIVGDEILSGRRQDRHFPRLLEILRPRGLELAWCVYLGDDRLRLIHVFRGTFAGDNLVFSFGGIGVTPDDHTRQAVAAALGLGLEVHPEARRALEARFGTELTPERLLLGEFPAGARIVPNPYNGIPGFAIDHHYFLPGFPEMAWPMVEAVLDTHYRHLQHARARAERALIVHFNSESRLLDLMRRIESEFPGLRVFSLPASIHAGVGPQIELGVRGEPAEIEPAMALMRAELAARGIRWEDKSEEG